LFPHMRDSEMTVTHSHVDGPISLSPGDRLDRVLYLLQEMMACSATACSDKGQNSLAAGSLHKVEFFPDCEVERNSGEGFGVGEGETGGSSRRRGAHPVTMSSAVVLGG
ncbi:hypothetical protein FOZ63_009692, partial [Perkinsus olseni]